MVSVFGFVMLFRVCCLLLHRELSRGLRIVLSLSALWFHGVALLVERNRKILTKHCTIVLSAIKTGFHCRRIFVGKNMSKCLGKMKKMYTTSMFAVLLVLKFSGFDEYAAMLFEPQYVLVHRRTHIRVITLP